MIVHTHDDDDGDEDDEEEEEEEDDDDSDNDEGRQWTGTIIRFSILPLHKTWLKHDLL